MNDSTSTHPLIVFLTNKMSMTDVYQPAVVKELLVHGGIRSKSDLARAFAQYDVAIQEYYEKVVMRWPRITLAKHRVVEYERRDRTFALVDYPEDEAVRETGIAICQQKIEAWLNRKAQTGKAAEPDTSVRYQVLKDAGGKCALCGIPSSLRPIDIDHIVPRSKANKHGKVKKDGIWIDVNARANLQALCMTCNRAKRAADETDFRRTSKLVRDGIPEIIRAEGRDPSLRQVSGRKLTNALFDKLVEEHAELIAAGDSQDRRLEELADMAEVIIALARQHDVDEETFFERVRAKRSEKGCFEEGFILMDALG